MSKPKPFVLNVPQETVDWVTSRVKTARIIPGLEFPAGEEWADGTPPSDLNEYVEFWRTKYDWHKVESKLNSTYKMFTLDIVEGDETINLHFVHHVSPRQNAIPLLFCHGWPGNFTEVENLLHLTEPENPDGQAFHIVAPSIPGFALSSSPKRPGFGIPEIGSVYHKLMQALGYKHYIVQGGDWGSIIGRGMAYQFPDAVMGLHLNFIVCTLPSVFKRPLGLLQLFTGTLPRHEKEGIKKLQNWMDNESGYRHIQGTKPQTISSALQDSPVGFLAWIREKLPILSGADYVWDKELVITWTMLYLLSASSGHARIYKEGMVKEKMWVLGVINPKVAIGVSIFPRDTGYVPRWWAESSLSSNIVFWKEHEKGGHFATIECPELIEADILDFVAKIATDRKKLLFGQGSRN